MCTGPRKKKGVTPDFVLPRTDKLGSGKKKEKDGQGCPSAISGTDGVPQNENEKLLDAPFSFSITNPFCTLVHTLLARLHAA